jgi:alpha-tubulin suppressor-like RCC1 family protein
MSFSLPRFFASPGRAGWIQAKFPLLVLLCCFTGETTKAAEVIGWGFNDYGQLNVPDGLTNVTAVATAGGFADVMGAYSLALRADGSIAAWGQCHDGQTSVPSGLSDAVAIAASTYHCLALRSNGRVVGWGNNDYGQTNVPPSLQNVVSVAAGEFHSLALTADGAVVGWGAGGPGQLGWPNTGQTTIPTGLSNVVAIAAGYYHSMALKADGNVVAWGGNNAGQTVVPETLSNVVAIASGYTHCLALQANGMVQAWGNSLEFAATVPEGLSNVIAVAAGGRVSLAIQSNGTVAGWGFWDTSDVPPALDRAAMVTAGYLHCMGLRDSSDVAAPPQILTGPFLIATVGRPFYQRILTKNRPTAYEASGLPSGLELDAAAGMITGTPNEAGAFPLLLSATNHTGVGERNVTLYVNRPLPAIATGGIIQGFPGQPFSLQVAADNNPAWFDAAGLPEGLTIDSGSGAISGTLRFATGDFPVSLVASNVHGVGRGSLTLRVSSVVGWGADSYGQATGPSAQSIVVAVACGGSHSLALLEDGTVFGWGQGPTNIAEGLEPVVAIAAGDSHDLALCADGTVVAWGDNWAGQTNVPPYLSNVVAIAAGGSHSLALNAGGMVTGWGAEGRGDRGQAKVPNGLDQVVAIAAGGMHSLALRANGTVVGWGDNTYGQTNTPSGLTNVVAIDAGDSHSLALCCDGTVVCWGRNNYGQTNVPSGLSRVVAVSAGATHNLALLADGTVVAWGNNASGQTNVLIGMQSVLAIAAGGAHSLALLPITPRLTIQPAEPDSIVLTWPSGASDWKLQESAGLFPAKWSPVDSPPFNDGSHVAVTINPPSRPRFFRLQKP